MEAKDTVMTDNRILDAYAGGERINDDFSGLRRVAIIQADVSFEAGVEQGRLEVVEYVDEDLENSSVWQAKKKKWGIISG